MSVQVSEEKINVQAAALEVIRNKILFEIGAGTNFRDRTPPPLGQLKSILEHYLYVQRFQEVKAEVMNNVSTNEPLTDEKVKTYLFNFIIEPTLENAYQAILDFLKKRVVLGLIPQFPLTTILLEDSVKAATAPYLPYRLPDKIMQTFSQFELELNLDTIPNVSAAIDAEVLMAERAAIDLEIKTKQLAESPGFSFVTFDINGMFLLNICCRVLEAIIRTYNLQLMKTEDDMVQLRKDFEEFCREAITHDTRLIGKISPMKITTEITTASKEIWTRVRNLELEEFAKAQNEGIIPTYSSRNQVKDMCFNQYKDHLNQSILVTLGSLPKSTLFVYYSYKKVREAIEYLIDEWFQKQVSTINQYGIVIGNQLNMYVLSLFSPQASYAFRYFILDPSINTQQLLSYPNRSVLIQLLLLADPRAANDELYNNHLTYVKRIADVLEVGQDPQCLQLVGMISSKAARRTNSGNLDAWRNHICSHFDSQTALDLPHMVYLIFGLYNLFLETQTDLLRAIDASKRNLPMPFKRVNFRKRFLLFQVLRSIKNGRFPILNYQIVLYAESVLESHRYGYNQRLQSTGALGNQYNLDFQETVDNFKKQSVEEIVQKIEENKPDEETGPRRPVDNFINKFVADTAFKNGFMGGLAVSSDMTINKMSQISSGKQMNPFASLGGSTPGGGYFQNNQNAFEAGFPPTPQLQNNMSIDTRQYVDPAEARMKLSEKIRYLKENVKTFEFDHLNAKNIIRSRSPILCVSGFLSEKDDPFKEWSQFMELYPFTEILSLNWESFGLIKSAGAMLSAMRGVSFRSLTSMFFSSLHDVLPGNQQANTQGIYGSNFIENRIDRQKLDIDPDQVGVNGNPFEGDQFQDYKNAAPGLGNDTENKGFLSLFKKNNLTDLFKKESWKQAAINLTMIPMTSKELMNPQYKNLSPGYPAFTLTTGVYDFYQKNPFTIANHHAVLSGQALALIMDKAKLFNNNPISMVGYSLGTVFVYHTLLTLYDLGCQDSVGDVCLLGACVDEVSLGQNIHKLVGSRGSMMGKLTIMYTMYDSVLKYMFRSVRLGENPVGLKKISFDYLANCLKAQDKGFVNASKEDILEYLRGRIDNIDASPYCASHFAFKKKAHLIMPHVEFNGDLKYFREQS